MFASCGKNVNIEHGADIGTGRYTEIGDNSGIGINCTVKKAIIGKNVMMGPDEEEILKMIMTIFEQYKSGELQSYNLPEFIKNYERSALTGQLAYWFDSLHQVR